MARSRLLTMLLAGSLCFAATAWADPERPPAGKIALTFDDLPALTIVPSQPYVNYLNAILLRELKLHHFPATGFVNESKFDDLVRAQQIEVLRHWLDAGMDLGNHTFSHDSPNDIGARAYIADIAKGEVVTRRLMAQHHKRERYFRHPYLQTGSPEAAKREIDDWLAAHGYTIAPVTMDADDWEFAEPYDDALTRRNAAFAAHIKAEYLSHTEDMIHWYRRAAQALFHRDIPYVILLHATRLNADSFEELAAMLKRNRLKPVSLDEAMRDPAYRTPDPYAGKDGIDWMERWALALHKPLPDEAKNDPPQDIVDAYNRVDNDQCVGTAAGCPPPEPAGAQAPAPSAPQPR